MIDYEKCVWGGFLASLFFAGSAGAAGGSSVLNVPLYATGGGYLNVISTTGIITPLAALPSGLSPNALTVDSQGNAYVGLGTGLIGHDFVEKITPQGAVSNYSTGLTTVSALAFDKSGNLYVSEEVPDKVIRVTPALVQNTYTTLPGEAEALAFDSKGNLLVDTLAGYVYKVPPQGTVGGTPVKFSSAAVSAQADAIDLSDNLFCTVGSGITEVNASGTVSSFGNTGNGADLLRGIALDSQGDLYVADYSSGQSSIGVFSKTGSYQTALVTSPVSLIAINTASLPEPTAVGTLLASTAFLCRRKDHRSRRGGVLSRR